MFYLLLLFSLVTLIWYFYKLEKNYYEKYKEVLQAFPNPKGLLYCPILGNWFIDREQDKIFQKVTQWDKGNKSYSLRSPIMGYYGIHLNNAEDAEVILTSSVNLKKSIVYNFLHDWLGTGLLTSSGNKWRKRRKMLTPAFHFGILSQLVEPIFDNSEKLVKKFEDECNKFQTNIKPIISNSALNIICETSLGAKLDAESEDNRNNEYVTAVHKIGRLITYRLTRPWVHSKFIFDIFFGNTQKKYLNIVHNFTKNLIIERENYMNLKRNESNLENIEDESETRKKFALLDLLLLEKEKNNIDLEGIREEVDTFVLEGHDTVSSSIVYTLNTLANNPEIQNKIVDELRKIFDGRKRRTTNRDLQKMNYLEMCIKESLRLYPSVYVFERQTTEDMTIRNVKLPKNSFCTVHVFALHRDPKHFPNPEKYDPERFSPENVIGRHPFAYIPFSAGLRNCIGQKYAMLELKSILSEILWNFVLEAVQETEDLKFHIDVVLRNKGPVNVKFRRRNHNFQ